MNLKVLSIFLIFPMSFMTYGMDSIIYKAPAVVIKSMSRSDEYKHKANALGIALIRGDKALVNYCIAQGADLKKLLADPAHKGLFARAISDGHYDIVKLMLEHGASANQTIGGIMTIGPEGISKQPSDRDCKETVLFPAIQHGKLKIVELLVSHEAKIDIRGTGGITPLLLAAEWGHLDILRFLISKGGLLKDTLDDGFTPLMLAIERHQDETAQWLIEQEAGVNVQAKTGTTALSLAVQWGRFELVKLLVAQGAEINKRTIGNETPLMLAAQLGYPKITRFLLSKNVKINDRAFDGFTAFLMAVQNGFVSIVRNLLAKGASKKTVNFTGQNALAIAASQGQKDMAEFLLKNGMDINWAVKKNKLTPLMFAVICNQVMVYRFLKTQGANSELRDIMGRRALDFARLLGNTAILNAERSLITSATVLEELYAFDEVQLSKKKSKKKKRKKHKKQAPKTLPTAIPPASSTSLPSSTKTTQASSQVSVKLPKNVNYTSIIAAYKRGDDESFVEFENDAVIRINDPKNNQKIQLFKDEIIGSVFHNMWQMNCKRFPHKRVKRWFDNPGKAVQSSDYDDLRTQQSDSQIIEDHNFAKAVDQFVATFGKRGYSAQNRECQFFVGELETAGRKQLVQFEYAYTPKGVLYHRLMRRISDEN